MKVHNQEKNNFIILWRIVFTYMILFYHFDNKYLITSGWKGNIGWYIGVEFFFIVSGYLLYSGFDKLKEQCRSGWEYFVYRYKKIYPYYLGAFIFSLVFYLIVGNSFSIGSIIKTLSYHFFEAFAMHGIGLDMNWNHINNTSWFISIMLISGFIIFHCLVKWKDNFVGFVAPLIIIVCFSYLYRNMGGIGAVEQISGLYNHQALMRGMAGMCLGIFAAQLNAYIKLKCRRIGLIRMCGQLGFIFVIAASFIYGNSIRDFLFSLILTICVGIGFLPTESTIVNSKFMQYWSSITLSIYLLHDAFRTFIFPIYIGIPETMPMKILYALIYMVVVTVCAVIFDAMIKRLLKKVAAAKNKEVRIIE